MCVVSFVGDTWRDHWISPIPPQQPNPYQQSPISIPSTNLFNLFKAPVTREEFDTLKREVEIMKKQLEGAKEYDKKNNEPNCEIEDKMELLKKIAALVGINLDEVLNK